MGHWSPIPINDYFQLDRATELKNIKTGLDSHWSEQIRNRSSLPDLLEAIIKAKCNLICNAFCSTQVKVLLYQNKHQRCKNI